MGANDEGAVAAPGGKAEHIALDLQAADAPEGAAQPSALKRINTAAALVREVDRTQQLAVEWKNLDAWVPTLFLAAPPPDADGSKQPPKEKQILFGNTAIVEPGEVMALMGPSGSGKSSLLTLLGGRSSARMSGSITFGGKPLSKPIKRKLGYVMQDDLLFAELTVYETLYFAAMLRLPRHWSKEAKLERVESVIAGLGMDKCRDTIIGSHMQRGVSGGERKRVSIGHELLINPSVVLLDEPTSGLDSTTALRLLHTLRTLATGGRTIITSIHQPSSRLYQQMDKLLLLSEGRTMFYGSALAAASWFGSLNAPCPFGVNIADHILDLANGQQMLPGGPAGAAAVPSGQRAKGSPPTAQELCDMFASRSIGLGIHGVQVADVGSPSDGSVGSGSAPSTSTPLLLAAPSAAASAAILAVGVGELDGKHGQQQGKPSSSSSTSVSVADVGDAEDEDAAVAGQGASGSKGGSRWGASWPQQVALLTVRSVRTRRFQSLSVQKILQNLAVAILAGLFWWQLGQKTVTLQSARDIGGLLFFIQLYLCFSTMFAALFTFPLEFNMLQKERQSGMYRLSAYYLARTASDFPMDLAVPSAFFIILYWMAGLRIDAGAFFAMWWGTMLVVLVAQTCGLLIGATVPNPQNSQTICTIIMLTMMLVGGYYVRDIPVWISWLKYISFIYWGYNVLLKIQFRHLGFPCSDVPNYNGTPASCDVADADVFPTDVDQNIARDVCILIAMLIVLRVLVYYSLQYRTTFRKGQRTTMIETLRRTMTRSRR